MHGIDHVLRGRSVHHLRAPAIFHETDQPTDWIGQGMPDLETQNRPG